MTDEKQLTLGDCKPGQIAAYTAPKTSGIAWIRRQTKLSTVALELFGNEIFYGPFEFHKNIPCRLATQAELDELAERIRRAND